MTACHQTRQTTLINAYANWIGSVMTAPRTTASIQRAKSSGVASLPRGPNCDGRLPNGHASNPRNRPRVSLPPFVSLRTQPRKYSFNAKMKQQTCIKICPSKPSRQAGDSFQHMQTHCMDQHIKYRSDIVTGVFNLLVHAWSGSQN